MSALTYPTNEGLKYKFNERKVLLIVIPVLSLFMTHLGCDCQLSKLLKSTDYYFILLSNILIITACCLYLRKAIQNLNKWLPWHNVSWAKRLSVQFLINFLVPLAGVIVLSYLLSYLLGWPFENMFRMHIELPVTVLLFVVMNIFFEWAHFNSGDGRLSHQQENKTKMASIMLKVGTSMRRISLEQIAFFSIKHGCIFATTFEGKKLLTDHKLDAIEDKIPDYFFRLNRQFLVNQAAIIGFRKGTYQKLIAELKDDENTEVTISKQKVSSFKTWLSGFNS